VITETELGQVGHVTLTQQEVSGDSPQPLLVSAERRTSTRSQTK